MACRWRIRRKLIFGLGLVAVILALLLVGTLKGLSSYRATMRTIDSKLVELSEADKLRAAIKFLADPPAPPPAEGGWEASPEPPRESPLFPMKSATPLNAKKGLGHGATLPKDGPPAAKAAPESRGAVAPALARGGSGGLSPADDLRGKIRKAREALGEYKNKLHETINHRHDPDNGYQEWEQVKALDERFDRLESALAAAETPTVISPYLAPQQETAVKAAIEDLIRTSADLNNVIYSDLYNRIKLAKHDYKISLAIVLTTSVLAVLLMTGLLRFLYRWLFYPIRDLHLGVNRVARGDFEHRIELHSGDEIEELAAAFNDMTGRLHAMYSDLARQVNDRSRQLVRSERLAGVGYLAAGVAHEINNPLASIALCSEALERRLADLLASRPAIDDQEREVLTKYLKMIQDEAFRCKKITQRLLEFSRGGQRQREPTDLADLVQGVLDMVQPLPNCKGKEVLFQPAEALMAWINGQDIKSVILNLIVNALDSMDEGGRLVISQRQREGMAELIFKDTGCGMTSEVLENLFEPFFTRSRTGKGTGLGLSISFRIVNQHGGEIEAASAGPGQGSTFVVRLPLKAPPEQFEGGKEADVQDPEAEFARLHSAQKLQEAA